MERIVAKFRKYRVDMNEKILNGGFKDFQKIFALDTEAFVEGALPAKMKEMMGVVGSAALRDAWLHTAGAA